VTSGKVSYKQINTNFI